MAELSTTKDRKSDDREPSVWEYFICVSLSIGLIIAAGKIVLSLILEKSKLVETEKVANQTYQKYSQQLEAISEMSAKELESLKKKR